MCKFHKSPLSIVFDCILGELIVVHDNDDDEDHNAAVGDDTDFSDHVDMFVFVEKWPKAVEQGTFFLFVFLFHALQLCDDNDDGDADDDGDAAIVGKPRKQQCVTNIRIYSDKRGKDTHWR